MIALASDCLIFRTEAGDSIPFSAEMICVEFAGKSSALVDMEFATEAAHAVFHYFKRELNRHVVSVGEFTDALEVVLQNLSRNDKSLLQPKLQFSAEADLLQLASEIGEGCELHFFVRLRAELRLRLESAPFLVRFKRLRQCVKKLAAAQRWCRRCGELESRILDYLRQCLDAEGKAGHLALIVE